MSNSTELKATGNPNEWTNWIKENITENYLKYYEYKYFSNIQIKFIWLIFRNSIKDKNLVIGCVL